MSMNRFVGVGRLVADPELRYTPAGHAVANFRIAINRPFKNEQGENEADFISCVAWRKQAENLANSMRKGQQIGVDGRIQTRNFEDKDGKTVYVTEVLAESIQFLEPKGNNADKSGQNYGQQNQGYQQNNQQYQQAPQNPVAEAGEEIS